MIRPIPVRFKSSLIHGSTGFFRAESRTVLQLPTPSLVIEPCYNALTGSRIKVVVLCSFFFIIIIVVVVL